MGRREKERKNFKLDFEDGDDVYQNVFYDVFFVVSDSDDEEVNEDLSFKIVEKVRLCVFYVVFDDGVFVGFLNDIFGEDIIIIELMVLKVLKKKVKKEKKKKVKKVDFEI